MVAGLMVDAGCRWLGRALKLKRSDDTGPELCDSSFVDKASNYSYKTKIGRSGPSTAASDW